MEISVLMGWNFIIIGIIIVIGIIKGFIGVIIVVITASCNH